MGGPLIVLRSPAVGQGDGRPPVRFLALMHQGLLYDAPNDAVKQIKGGRRGPADGSICRVLHEVLNNGS
jgi:hypothetical protein